MPGGFVTEVRWIQKPVNAPFTCAWCHVGHEIREQYLDTGLSYDFEGTVYLCDACSITVRKGANWFDKSDVDSMVAVYKETIDDLTVQLEDLAVLRTFCKKYGIDPVGVKELANKSKQAEKELFYGFGGIDASNSNSGTASSDPNTDGNKSRANSPVAATLDSLFLGAELS